MTGYPVITAKKMNKYEWPLCQSQFIILYILISNTLRWNYAVCTVNGYLRSYGVVQITQACGAGPPLIE